MMDGFLRVCRHCKTACYDTFPRMNCQCGRNEPDPDPSLEAAPAGDFTALDPYGYDLTSPAAPDADRAGGRDAPSDDSLFWWS